jgi:hypothetical protein
MKITVYYDTDLALYIHEPLDDATSIVYNGEIEPGQTLNLYGRDDKICGWIKAEE